MDRKGARRAVFLLGLVLCAASVRSSEAMPNIVEEPYKRSAGVNTPLSTDPGSPTVFLWNRKESIRWFARSDSAPFGLPRSEWHIRDSHGKVSHYPAQWCSGPPTRFCTFPEQTLAKGDYEFWVTAIDDEGTDTSGTYYIRMTFPPVVPTNYHSTATEFLGKLARVEHTAFNFGAIPNGILDTPEVDGCDNPSMFYGDGKLHFIFGDPNIYTGDPGSPTTGLHGAMAFTEHVVPEKGINISHRRNWIVDPDAGTAKSLIEVGPRAWRTNNTSGAILPHGTGHRVWFAMYDYGSGPRESYRNYYRVAIVYCDDNFATPAVRDDNLILWDKDDPGNGPNNPDPYLGFSMRLFKDHLYMMIPREGGSSPVLLRCHVDDLDNRSLTDWHYLTSVGANGAATWSAEGVTRGQISRADFPTVNFGAEAAGIVDTVVWNPYLNRWIAVSALGMTMWESRYLWGPYTKLQSPQLFSTSQFAEAYSFFAHELMLGNNGEWIYNASARSWTPVSLYGTYNERVHMRDKLRMTVSPKSGAAGDPIAITCTNDSGFPPPPPQNLTVTVDGHPASFVRQAGDTYQFSFELTGQENGGNVGVVDVAGTMAVPMDGETSYVSRRDALLVVNRRNNLNCAISSPAEGAAVSGWVPIRVSAAYDTAPEILAPQQPEVRILKTELRHIGPEETVLDVAVEPPYTLMVDSTRLSDGPQRFKVIAYDTIDRRGEASITLNVRNSAQAILLGNLVVDGNMEAPDAGSWQPLYGAIVRKVSDDAHRSGRRSLLVHSDTPSSWAGVTHRVTGLTGGECLRFTAWTRLENNYTAGLLWLIKDRSGSTINSQYVNSYGFFRRVLVEFDNPPGNTELLLQCLISDTGSEGVVAGEGVTSVDAVVDDVALQPACYAVVEGPANVRTEDVPASGATAVTWDPVRDVNVEYYRIFRRSVSQGPSAWQEIGEVHSYEYTYTDENAPGPPGDNEYKVVSIDEMGWESTSGGPDLAPSLVRLESSSCPGSSPITARIRNLGAGIAPPPVRVAFYDGSPGTGGLLVGMAQTSGTLAPGAYEDVSTDPFPALAGPHTICVVADDDGLGSGSVAECSEANNERCDALVFCNGAPRADAGGPYAQPCDGGTARVQLDGSGSSDPESEPLTYAWITDCPGGTFSDPASAAPILSMQCAPPCPPACAVTLIATDAQGGQDADTAGVSVQVDPLGELSNVSRGAPALRVVDTTPNGVVVEKDPHATAYNVYADALGSWYAPTAAKGTACGISTWSDNRDGTVTLDYQVPPNSWVVVTSSNACHEGSAGSRSDGTSRTEIGTWPSCVSPW